MEFKKVEEGIVKNAMEYGEKYNVKIDEDFALLKLYEEVGELSQAVLIHRKKSRPEKYLNTDASLKEVADELADVLGMVIVNAHLFGVDLEEAVNRKWINRKE